MTIIDTSSNYLYRLARLTTPNQETQYDVAERIATITLNRPDQRNAWTAVMEHEVRAAIAAAENDENVRVIVLTGAGRGFCARGHVTLEHDSGKRNRRGATGPGGPARRRDRRGHPSGFSKEIFVIRGAHHARDCGHQRSDGGLETGDCLVLRFTSCLRCDTFQHSICAAGIDCRVRTGMDVAASRGPWERAAPALFRKNGDAAETLRMPLINQVYPQRNVS
jgi:hypothetical protein